MHIQIELAQPADAPIITEMVGELLGEIMAALDEPVFGFDPMATENRARGWLADGISFMWLARARDSGEVLGFVAAYEGHALYAEGAFGTISELFVRPAYRSQRIGAALLDEVKRFAKTKRWTRLEVTTPPLPPFNRTLAFYARHGFTISGGRKMKMAV